jgi:hypothetical protein
MNDFLAWIWDNRTKHLGYIGSALITLGTSGLVSPKAALWCAFVSTLLTSAVGHYNDYLKRKEETP